MKRLALVNLSHEVRTPLNAVVNCLEMALEADLDQKTKETLQMSYSASKSLIFVIDELLHFTYKKQPTPTLMQEAFDLHRSMRETLEPLGLQARRKGLGFNIHWENGFPRHVLGDQHRLQQAVTNLVVNAIQYTQHGWVNVTLGLVRATESGYVIRITVQDSGCSMSEDDLDSIFQDLEQVSDESAPGDFSPMSEESVLQNTSMRDGYCHVGLGLATLARYIKSAGGYLKGKSTPAIGTTFTVELPLEADPHFETPSEESSIDSSPKFITPSSTFPSTPFEGRPSLTKKFSSSPEMTVDTRSARENAESNTSHGRPTLLNRDSSYESIGSFKEKLCVIVADDNVVNCAILSRRLSKAGHDVKVCRDGQQCVEAYQQDRFGYDFILMDLNVSPQMANLQPRTYLPSATTPCAETIPKSPSFVRSGWLLLPKRSQFSRFRAPFADDICPLKPLLMSLSRCRSSTAWRRRE
jgi:CheY-like chemotaxis protein